jgi:hypothetical protein
MNGLDLEQLLRLSHSPLQNYIIPGLTSSLLAAKSDQGVARLFINSRRQYEHITPHSHRFDFQCLVLRGEVTNIVFQEIEAGDEFCLTAMEYGGAPGQYETESMTVSRWEGYRHCYRAGDWYGMTHDQVHSIVFSRDAVVLFLEGPAVTTTSLILEPVVDGKRIKTFRTEPWMFTAVPEVQS